MVDIKDIIGRTAIVVFIILAVIFITQIILKLIGESPSDVQILYLGFGAVISYLFIMSYKWGLFMGETKEFIRGNREFMRYSREFMSISKNTFRKLGEEVEEIAKRKK